MPKTRIVIDSRAREGGDVKNFWLELVPTIENVRKVSLVWADIPNPLQSPGGPYFLIRIPELGTRTRLIGSTTTSVTGGVATTTAGRRRGGVINTITDGFGALTGAAIDELAPDGGTTTGDTTTGDTTTTEEPAAAQPVTYYTNQHGLETTFVVPITVNVDERVFYSPETSFRQEMNYNPPISIQRLSPAISRTYDATQITGESVMILELEHD